jgi:glycosyltransferase involved in cell wall biosynthesis
MRRPRLLAVTGRAPWPPDGGFKVRIARLLEALAHTWDISLLVAEPMEAGDFPLSGGAHEFATTGYTDAWRARPRGGPQLDRLRREFAHLLGTRGPDACLLFHGAEFLGFGRSDLPPTVADRIDCMTLEALRRFRLSPRPRHLRHAIALAAYERRAVREMDATIAVGEADVRALARLGGVDSVSVVRHSVDADPGPDFSTEAAVPTVVYSGSMYYYTNVDAVEHFVRRIWPAVRERVPAARFVIAGRRPADRVLRLAESPGVEVRENVPDMASVLRESWLTVVPMRAGGGVKIKILEAWAVGRPAVITPLTTNGLHLGPESKDLVVRDPGAFAGVVADLLQDPHRRHAIGRQVWETVRAHHAPEVVERAATALLRGRR